MAGSSVEHKLNVARRGRRGIDRAWVVIGAVLMGALAMMIVGALMAPERQDDMWVNIVSRSAQLIALALAGGVVGAVIHDRDAAREASSKRDAFLRAFLDEVESAFVQVKTSRRLLRTFGFDGQRHSGLGPAETTGFRTQMAALNEAELQFETQARKAAALAAPFGSAATEVIQQLTLIHRYVNEILREWEEDPGAVTDGGSTAMTDAWPHFRGFVTYDEGAEHSFKSGVAERVLAVEIAVRGISEPSDVKAPR